LKDIKYITIHGPATCYKAVIFKLGDHPLEQKAGYTECRYIGMIIIDPDYRKVLIDDVYGDPSYAIREAGLDPEDYVLRLGWWTVLHSFDKIPNGGNIEIRSVFAEITDEWHF